MLEKMDSEKFPQDLSISNLALISFDQQAKKIYEPWVCTSYQK